MTLAKELGVYRRLPSAEYRELCQNRERADRVARELYERIKARRFELLNDLETLNRLELRAHEAGPEHAATWHALALVYRARPGVLAELVVLENSRAADLVPFLSAGPEERRRATDGAILRGGLYDQADSFVDLSCIQY